MGGWDPARSPPPPPPGLKRKPDSKASFQTQRGCHRNRRWRGGLVERGGVELRVRATSAVKIHRLRGGGTAEKADGEGPWLERWSAVCVGGSLGTTSVSGERRRTAQPRFLPIGLSFLISFLPFFLPAQKGGGKGAPMNLDCMVGSHTQLDLAGVSPLGVPLGPDRRGAKNLIPPSEIAEARGRRAPGTGGGGRR